MPRAQAGNTKRNNIGVVFIPAQKYDDSGKVSGKFDAVYENAIYTQLKANGGKVTIRARGKAIGRAANITAKAENRGFCKITQGATEIFTEEMDDGKFCSAIKIEMAEK